MDPFAQITPGELAARLEAERRGKPFLEHLDEAGRLSLLPLPDSGRTTIGRDVECDLAVPWDRETSRTHAVVERVGPSWTILDDGLSRNGSFVNGMRIHGRQRLADGDRIRTGTSLIVFRDPGSENGATTPSAPDGADRVTEVTAAQRRVLVALCRPFAEPGISTPASNRQIAEELVISVDGVRSHLKQLFTRLGVDDLPPNRKRAELVKRAFALGLITRRDLEPSPEAR